MMFNSISIRYACGLAQAGLLLSACGIVCVMAACSRPPVTKDLSALNTATRIEISERGLRSISTVTDPKKISVAIAFITRYSKGWKSPKWQGGVFPRRSFAFWDGDHYLGEFGISRDFLTTDNYYQEAPADEIAKIAAELELKWPPPD